MLARGDIFCVGVGGMGMAPLALYLRQQGFRVWGYDDALASRTRSLLVRGGVRLIDDLVIPQDCSEVIISSAIAPGHPLCVEAQRRNISIVRRGERLAQALVGKKLLAVVGSHGKTTTTALLIAGLKSVEIPFSYVLGGLFRSDAWIPACYDEKSEWAIVEVDESDGTLKHFSPEVTLTVNFDWDHISHYSTQGALENAFGALFQQTQGAVIIPSQESLLRELAAAAQKPVITFGEDGEYCGLFKTEGYDSGTFELIQPRSLPRISVPFAGAYNGRNLLAMYAGASVMGADIEGIHFDDYPGVSRRQDVLWNGDSLYAIADYAHHPAEVAAIIEALQEGAPEGPLTVVFQPHRYTRTRHLASDFAKVLATADEVHLLPVYAASETPLGGGTSQSIVDAWPSSGKRITSWDGVCPEALKLQLLNKNKGTIAFLGAGDIEVFAHSFRQALIVRMLACSLSKETYFAENEPLAKKTTLRVGGNARYYAEPASQDDLIYLLRAASSLNVPVFMLGRGSNIIVSDAGFDGLVVRLSHSYWKRIERHPDGRIEAGAGVRLKELCGFACKEGMSGFEFLEGIPGALGGALRMNAGAMGGWMFDVVDSVTWITPTGAIKHWKRDAFNIEYRQCRELLDGVALSAVLVPAATSDSQTIQKRMQDYASSRKCSQPREPSAGCIFKNAKTTPAGKLVDELGLKGLSRGQAEVSLAHGNFIINKGGATSRDVLGLVREVHHRVRQETGIVLEPEVLLLGEHWEEVLSYE